MANGLEQATACVYAYVANGCTNYTNIQEDRRKRLRTDQLHRFLVGFRGHDGQSSYTRRDHLRNPRTKLLGRKSGSCQRYPIATGRGLSLYGPSRLRKEWIHNVGNNQAQNASTAPCQITGV